VELIRWLRKLTKGVRRHKGMGHGQKIGLHLSNARKDTLQLHFSKMGLRSHHSARRHCGWQDGSRESRATLHTECRRRLGCSVGVEGVVRKVCAEGLCGRLSSEVEELLRNRKVRWGEGVDVN
jgi:hypothetical protein